MCRCGRLSTYNILQTLSQDFLGLRQPPLVPVGVANVTPLQCATRGSHSHKVLSEVVECSVVGGAIVDSLTEVELRLFCAYFWQTAEIIV